MMPTLPLRRLTCALALLAGGAVHAADNPRDALLARLDAALPTTAPALTAWRHDIHQHPELGNREFRTSTLVADALRGFGLEVKTGLAHTAVIGVLRGGLPGPRVALRAELDALPVAEPPGLPYASTAKAAYEGREVGVMHACGHDAHVAILLGVARLLAQARDSLPGTVVFVFQPAEEGTPAGEEGGAALLVKQGLLDPKPAAFFGLHVGPGPSGSLSVSRERVTAGSDTFHVKVQGRQSHAAMPWYGVDPVTVAAQIALAWQTIPSRQADLGRNPAPVITVGKIAGGVRTNILPDSVLLEGTLRTPAAAQRADTIQRMERTAASIAAASGASVTFAWEEGYPPGANDPALVDSLLPVLQDVAGVRPVRVDSNGSYAADDFAYFSRAVPGFFFGLGVTPPGIPAGQAAPNHSPQFVVDDAALPVGTRALLHVVVSHQFGAGGGDGAPAARPAAASPVAAAPADGTGHAAAALARNLR
jgi:amidohydrolase